MDASGGAGIRPKAAAVRSLVKELDSFAKTQSENLINPIILFSKGLFKFFKAKKHIVF